MNPLLLKFKEKPKSIDIDNSLLKYDDHLNLSVDSKTGIPAVQYMQLETETFTRTHEETSDSDYEGGLTALLGTELMTQEKKGETTSSDINQRYMYSLTGTETWHLTANEDSDSDNNYSAIAALVGTETLTERIENTDQDT